MSEKKDDKTFSDKKSEKIEPTVISIGQTRKKVIGPTVILGRITPETIAVDAKKEMKPTVIEVKGIVVGEGEIKKKLMEFSATVIRTDADKSFSTQPTAVAGVNMKGLKVTRDELLRHFPNTNEEVLNRTIEILSCVVVDMLTEERCSQWGVEIQGSHGKLADESFQLTNYRTIQTSNHYLGRLLELLEAIADSFEDRGGFLQFWKKKDPREKFQEFHSEIHKLSGLLNSQVSELMEFQKKFQLIVKKYQALLLELDAKGIAANYLAIESKKTEKKSQLLLQRSLSLSQTVAFMQQGEVMNESTIQTVERLISKIREGVLVRLPAWIEQINSYMSSRKLTETDEYVCKQGLQKITQFIKRE